MPVKLSSQSVYSLVVTEHGGVVGGVEGGWGRLLVA